MAGADAQEYIRERISDHCVEIEDIFLKDRPRYVTVIVRPPDRPEQEVIVTNDPDAQAVIATIQRRFGLAVPQGERAQERCPHNCTNCKCIEAIQTIDAVGKRMMEKHRKSLERLADPTPEQETE